MGQAGSLRRYKAALGRMEREEKRRQRELERLEKERAKLSALEQARLEVDTFENQLEVLRSVHRETCAAWDWLGIASSLPDPPPKNNHHTELRARRLALVARDDERERLEAAVAESRQSDAIAFQAALEAHAREIAEIEKMRALALRVLAGESMAIIEAFAELNPAAEISATGSLRQFAVHSENLIECVFKASANNIIPSQVKTLTSSGKVSIKAMPRGQQHELYQDYICACVLRIAREVFAMFSVSNLIVTAVADVPDRSGGESCEHPVLSVAIDRGTLAGIDFARINSTDAINAFQHRGDFKASRKAGAFQPIKPFCAADFCRSAPQQRGLDELRTEVRLMREAIKEDLA